MSLLQGGHTNQQDTGEMSSVTGDINLTDPGVMMMDDFAPDIDLLDDILGMDVDWKELEPTLLNLNQSNSNSSHSQIIASMSNNLNGNMNPLTTTNSSQQHHITPDFLQDIKPNLNFLQNGTSTNINLSPQPPPISLEQTQFSSSNFNNTTPKLLTQVSLAPGQGQNILPNLQLPQNHQGQGQIFSFTYPLAPQLYNTAVLLPQLQLAVMDNNKEKLPVKRITTMPKAGVEKEPKKGKKEANRRSSHNAIERRYRSSINDKIIELKNLVCQGSSEPNEKVHKAAVLKSSIDTIKGLQSSNSRLEKENRSLKINVNSLKKCINCGFENNSIPVSDLRDLLSNTPPPTSSSESDSSSLPCSPISNPDSPLDNTQENLLDGKGSPRQTASPLALFAIAAGLFLINPISSINNNGHLQENVGDHHRSRVERSVGDTVSDEPLNYGDYSWTPKIIALTINLFLFLCIYFVSGKLFGNKSKLSRKLKEDQKVISELEDELNAALKLKCANEKLLKLEGVITKSFGYQIPRSRLTLKMRSACALMRVPWIILRGKRMQNSRFADVIGKYYVEIGKIIHLADEGTKLTEDLIEEIKFYCGVKGLQYGLKSNTTTAQEILLSACILTKSKLVFRATLLKLKTFKATDKLDLHPLFSPKLGIPFLNNNLKKPIFTQPNIQTTAVGVDPLSKLMHKYKNEMISRGIAQLFHCGDGAIQFFRASISAVLYEEHVVNGKFEKGSNQNVRSRFRNNSPASNMNEKFGDVYCEWWASILWCQAEWITRGGRPPVLERLYKVIDTLWKFQSEEPICRALYFAHLAKRTQMMECYNEKVLRLVENSSEALRDSINLTTEKPKQSTQLIWAITAESILETRLELWDDQCSNVLADREFLRMFSRDLDTLRSLTHVVPSCLPSVYLYEACLRLMSKAAPGRTQQLLDASLRSVRLNQTRGLICNNNNVDGNEAIELIETSMVGSGKNLGSGQKSTQSCNKRKSKWDKENLVKEKRKAIALYLRCKHLPSPYLACSGEKAGMLREALKAMEKFGDHKKINECLEMIRSLGQSVTLH